MLIREFGKESIRICLAVATLIGLLVFIVKDGVKPIVQRQSPLCQPELSGLIHHLSPVNCGYSFVSMHAATTFALAIFLTLLFKGSHTVLKISLFAWASLIAYSRIYNGFHFPGDVIGAVILGWLITYPVYAGYHWLETHAY